jgi:hypothetical protein
MATWNDVRRIALGLPETAEVGGGHNAGAPAWKVKTKTFVWERPLRNADLAALGDAAPTGPILGVRVADVGVKEALVASNADVYFTTPHFEGFPAVLVQLDNIGVEELRELVVEAWLVQAPKRVSNAYLADRPPPTG